MPGGSERLAREYGVRVRQCAESSITKGMQSWTSAWKEGRDTPPRREGETLTREGGASGSQAAGRACPQAEARCRAAAQSPAAAEAGRSYRAAGRAPWAVAAAAALPEFPASRGRASARGRAPAQEPAQVAPR